MVHLFDNNDRQYLPILPFTTKAGGTTKTWHPPKQSIDASFFQCIRDSILFPVAIPHSWTSQSSYQEPAIINDLDDIEGYQLIIYV